MRKKKTDVTFIILINLFSLIRIMIITIKLYLFLGRNIANVKISLKHSVCICARWNYNNYNVWQHKHAWATYLHFNKVIDSSRRVWWNFILLHLHRDALRLRCILEWEEMTRKCMYVTTEIINPRYRNALRSILL